MGEEMLLSFFDTRLSSMLGITVDDLGLWMSCDIKKDKRNPINGKIKIDRNIILFPQYSVCVQ